MRSYWSASSTVGAAVAEPSLHLGSLIMKYRGWIRETRKPTLALQSLVVHSTSQLQFKQAHMAVIDFHPHFSLLLRLGKRSDYDQRRPSLEICLRFSCPLAVLSLLFPSYQHRIGIKTRQSLGPTHSSSTIARRRSSTQSCENHDTMKS